MIAVEGESNERLVLDGEWLEKQRMGQPKARIPASSFRSVEWKDFSKRKKLFGGEKVQMVQLVLTFEKPPFIGSSPRPRSGRSWKRSSPASKRPNSALAELTPL